MIRFTKAKPKPKKPKQKGSKKTTLNKLKSFLAAAEPEVVEILVSHWNAQTGSVTYKELREAYLAGGLTEQQFQKWQKDYSQLVISTLAPKWQQAADAAAQEVQAKYPYFVYEPSVSASMNFIKQHGAELVTNLAQEQRDALNAVIAHCSGYTAVTPDEAARMIRPCIGLTKPQALANMRYQEAVKAAYLKAHPKGKQETAEKKAADAAAQYAARQHRYRAQNIARTELAFAYNAGHYGATKDAQAQGYIGDCMKVWLTAYDERVCPICSKMDEEKRNMDVPFSNGKLFPPGHPQCRCAVAYEEIPGTNLNPVPTVPAERAKPPEELPMSRFLREDGTFNLEKAKEFYRNLLQSAPEKNRMYLQQALEAVTFEQRTLESSAFGYNPTNDVIAYDSTNSLFPHYDFSAVLTHELAHRIDRFFVRSWEQEAFKATIQASRQAIDVMPDFFIQFCEQNDSDGFLSDCLSALCKDQYTFPAGHSSDYWNEDTQAAEVFANLFSLETYQDSEKLGMLRTYFSALMEQYWNLPFEL